MSSKYSEISKESSPIVPLEDADFTITLDQSNKTIQQEEPNKIVSKKLKTAFLDWLDKYWFIIGLGVAVLLAYAVPQVGKQGGYIHSEITTKYLAVSVTFLLSGMSLKLKEVLRVLKLWKLHVTVQTINLLVIPVFMFLVVQFLDAAHILAKTNPLAQGLVIVGSLPTTINACVILTKSANANDIAALFNATTGNLLGMIITPLWLLAFLGRSSSSASPLESVVISLICTVLLPIIVGQAIALIFPAVVAKMKQHINFGKVNNVILLIIVFATFCDTFSKPSMITTSDLVLILFITVICHLICLLGTFGFSAIKIKHHWGFNRKDRITILLTATQKTLSVGIPFINILYTGDPTVGLKSLPLLIQHPTQILVASLLMEVIKSWISKEPVPTEDENEQNAIPLQA
jgi:sodium/bile acid cotransporter 7